MRFSVKWAASAPVYVGMAVGIVMMFSGSTSLRGWPLTIMGGMFMGAAFGLPSAAANLVGGILVAGVLRCQPFVAQFGMFALASAMFNTLLLRWLDHGLRGIGGVIGGPRSVALYLAFGAASLLVAWLLMRFEGEAHS